MIESQLLERVRQSEPEMVDFCSRLLQTPSVNGVNDERALAEVIVEQARSLGLFVQIAGENPRRPNVIISTDEQRPTGLLLIGHLDTVPPGDETQWTYRPFSGTVTNGRVYGRGAIDTKGGMTSALYALAALKAVDGGLPNRRAQLICVPDEESGATGDLGIKYLRANGLLSGLGAVYAYSGDDITLGHRGLVRYRLICRGAAIHTGAMEWQEGKAGANAVTGMARLLVELEQVEWPHSDVPYFEPFRTIMTPGTVIQGGVSINIVPDVCEALVDVRLTPEVNRDQIEAQLMASIDQVNRERLGLNFEYQLLNYAPAAITDENALVVLALEDSVRQVKGITPKRVVAGPANEGYLLIERGIPTICGFGPSGANAHAIDEYVEIQGLVDAACIFALTACRLSQEFTA